jgi:hypothetical protein
MADAARWGPKSDDPNTQIECEWREAGAPIAPGEYTCPICGQLAYGSERYPHRLCPACEDEATDAAGRPVIFIGDMVSGLGGEFHGLYAEDRSPYAGFDCFVRGVRCRAEEHRLGGVVLQPERADADRSTQ